VGLRRLAQRLVERSEVKNKGRLRTAAVFIAAALSASGVGSGNVNPAEPNADAVS